MPESAPSVYDYSPAQAAMIRLYDLRLNALISRRYHGTKLAHVSRRIAWAEILAALSSSAAVASLATVGWQPGAWLYAALGLLAACASVYRTAFRLTEQADRHARLATAWSEVFLDIDRLLSVIRRGEKLSDIHLAQINDLEVRFERIEMMDDSAPDRKLHEHCQKEAMQALPTDRNWLPSE